MALQYLLIGFFVLFRSRRRNETVGAEQHHQHQHQSEQAELQVDERVVRPQVRPVDEQALPGVEDVHGVDDALGAIGAAHRLSDAIFEHGERLGVSRHRFLLDS